MMLCVVVSYSNEEGEKGKSNKANEEEKKSNKNKDLWKQDIETAVGISSDWRQHW